MNVQKKQEELDNGKQRRSISKRLGGRLPIVLTLLASIGGGSVATAASGETANDAKPNKQKPTAVATYHVGKRAVKESAKLTYKDGVFRAHDTYNNGHGTVVDQYLSISENTDTVRYREIVDSKPGVKISTTMLTADYKVGDQWKTLYQPDHGSSGESPYPIHHLVLKAAPVELSPDEEVLAAGADAVRWHADGYYADMDVTIPATEEHSIPTAPQN